MGNDASDPKSIEIGDTDFGDVQESFKGKRFGVFKDLFRDSIFKKNMDKIKEAGGEIVLIAPRKSRASGFFINLKPRNER